MEKWQDSLPDEMRANPTLAKYNTQEDALNALIAGQSKLGRSLTVPGEGDDRSEFYDKVMKLAPDLTLRPDAGDEDHEREFWRMAGVPESDEGYKPPEDIKLPQEFADNTRKLAKEAGLTVKQYNAVMKSYDAEYVRQQEMLEQARADDNAVLTSAWGMAEKDKRNAVDALVSQFEDPNHPLGELNSAGYLLLAKVAESLTGKGAQAFQQPSGSGGQSPEELDEKIFKLREKMLKQGNTAESVHMNRNLKNLLKLRYG